MKYGNLNFLEPAGPLQTSNGTALPLPLFQYIKTDNCLQLFDHCLAPNTLGDGTGCDNMTAVIVQFQTELVNQDDRKSAKRSASPGLETSSDTTKRPKTEETPCV